MYEFIKYLADRWHCTIRDVVDDAMFELYKDEWIEWRKLKEATD